MANYKEFPEILAMLIFLPAGIFMGHMMNYCQTTLYATNAFYNIQFWPFVIGGVMALLMGIVHLGIKLKYKQYKYEHMYFQMIGLVLLMITGVLLMFGDELEMAAFVGFAGHGIIYISALSYINIRTGKSKHRYLKLSIPHMVYLFGISLGSTLVWTSNDFKFYQSDIYDYFWYNYSYDGMSTGTVLMITSCAILGGFLISEVLQYSMRSYNYKESLDNDINRENVNKEILKNKYFHITPPHLGHLSAQVPLRDVPLKTESSGIKELGIIIYTLATKFLTLMFFYYPFLLLFMTASIYSYDDKIYIVNWFGTAGIVVSLILMILLNFKINFLLSITIRCVLMIVLLIVCSFDYMYWSDVKIPFWFVFMGLGFGFSHPDINILSYTNLKSNEIVLAIGYFIEHLIIGILQYESTFNPLNIFDDTSNFYLIFKHALTFILILLTIGLIGIFVIPNGKHSSLFEIKNILNNCANINQLVNTGNYDGQQNPQLYYQQQMYLQHSHPQIAQMQQQMPPPAYDPNNSAYRPPYAQNMFQYGHPTGQPIYLPPPQQYPQYQQTPYLNTTYPNQMNSAPGPYNNENNSSVPFGMMPQQNFQNLPPNVAPLTDDTYSPPSQYDKNLIRPIIPPANSK